MKVSTGLKNIKGGRYFTGVLRTKILERDNHRCIRCGKTPTDGIRLEVDHIIEFEDGGKTTFENGQTLCAECNKGKSGSKKISESDEIVSITEFGRRVGVHRNGIAEAIKENRIEVDRTTGKINYTTEIIKWFNKKAVNTLIVNKTELARIIGKTQKTLTEWQEKGLPIHKRAEKKGFANEYSTAEVIEWMVSRNNKKLDYNEERTRLTSLQADRTDLEIKQIKGDLLPVEVMTMIWGKTVAAAKNRILGIRADVKMKNPKITNDILDVIQSVCKEALNELSTGKLSEDSVKSIRKLGKDLEATAKLKSE